MHRSLPGDPNTFPSILVQLALRTERRGKRKCVWLLTLGEQGMPVPIGDQVVHLLRGSAAGTRGCVPSPILSLGLAA